MGENRAIKLIFNNVEYNGKISNESSDRRRVRIFWNSELGNVFKNLRTDETIATFIKIAESTYEVRLTGGEEEVLELSIKERMELIKEYIASKGFSYDGELMENFYLSLKSKPFES